MPSGNTKQTGKTLQHVYPQRFSAAAGKYSGKAELISPGYGGGRLS